MKGREDGVLRRMAGSLTDMLYPPVCPVCGRILTAEEGLICPRCRRELPVAREPRCMCCGKPVSRQETELCDDCMTHPRLFDEGRAALLYERGVRSSVDRLKFHNRREYTAFYASCLYDLARECFPRWRPVCLVPVPMHPRRRAERGYDQAVLLASALADLTALPVREDILLRTRYTRASRKLGRAARRKNLRGVFAVRRGAVIPPSIVLIDDIYTTGATMDEASFALRRAGAEHIFFLTVCTGRSAV